MPWGKSADVIQRGYMIHFKISIAILVAKQQSKLFYRLKATIRVNTSQILINHLPSLSFGWPTIAVDTHIDRVSNRTKFAMGKNVVEVEQKLLKVVPAEFKVDVHHWLILHGRYTCVARKPRCGACIIEDLCEFKDKSE